LCDLGRADHRPGAPRRAFGRRARRTSPWRFPAGGLHGRGVGRKPGQAGRTENEVARPEPFDDFAGIAAPTMFEGMRKVQEIAGVTPDRIPLDELMAAQQPAVLKGAANDWPLVARGQAGAEATIDDLKVFDGGRRLVGYTGAPEIGGRFFYDSDLTGLNFEAARAPLGEFLDRIAASLEDPETSAFYIGSTDLDLYLPGFRSENDLALDPASLGGEPPLVSIWIGNRTVATAHFDMSNNLACSLVGRRRVTLFPPDQVSTAYQRPVD